MRELFAGRLAPITYEAGFIECDCARVVEEYLRWMEPIQRNRGVRLVSAKVNESLENTLRRLLPLTSVEARRFLFLPTASPWTTYFDNGHRSSDAFPPMSELAQTIGCRAIRCTYIPENSPTGDFAAPYSGNLWTSQNSFPQFCPFDLPYVRWSKMRV